MKFSRNSVIVLYLVEKAQAAIVNALQHLDVVKYIIFCIIALNRDTGSIDRWVQSK